MSTYRNNWCCVIPKLNPLATSIRAAYILLLTTTVLALVEHSLQFVNGQTTAGWVEVNESETYSGRHECSFVRRQGAATATAKNNINDNGGSQFYLFGGRESAKSIDTYHTQNRTWTRTAKPAKKEFNHFQATEFQGLIWVIGAYQTNSFPNETPDDTIRIFDPANDVWMDGPMVPPDRRRGSAGLVVYDDKFYIVAGSTNGHSGGYVNWFDEYNPRTAQWTRLSPAPRPRDHFHAIIAHDQLYAIGGRLSGGVGGALKPLVPEIDIFHFMNSTWSTLPHSANLPNPRAASAMAYYDHLIMVMGGETAEQAWSLVEGFDPITRAWKTLPSMNHKRHGTQAIVTSNGVYVTAGSPNPGGGAQKNMEVYRSVTTTPLPDDTTASQSTPGILAFVDSSDNNNSIDSVRILKDDTVEIQLAHVSGSQGVFVEQILIVGNDKPSDFVFGGVPREPFLILRDESVLIAMTYIGTCTNANAELQILHSGSITTRLSLIGSYNIHPSSPTAGCTTSGSAPFVLPMLPVARPMKSPLTIPLSKPTIITSPSQLPSDVVSVMINLTLVNTDTDQDIMPLINGTIINLKSMLKLSVRANVKIVSSQSAVSVVHEVQFYYDNLHVRTESLAPYMIAGDDAKGDFFPWYIGSVGDHTISCIAIVATATSMGDGSTSTGSHPSGVTQFKVVNQPSPVPVPILLPTASSSTPNVATMYLVNAKTGKELQYLTNGTIIELSKNSELNVIVITDPYPIGSNGYVEFLYDNGIIHRTEKKIPYAMTGDRGGMFNIWTPTVGTHVVTVTPYSSNSSNGFIMAGIACTITFTAVL